MPSPECTQEDADLAMHLAREAAAQGDPLTAGHEYLQYARANPLWEPHGWVTDAIVRGIQAGRADEAKLHTPPTGKLYSIAFDSAGKTGYMKATQVRLSQDVLEPEALYDISLVDDPLYKKLQQYVRSNPR